jgi:predicted transcriptional regulator
MKVADNPTQIFVPLMGNKTIPPRTRYDLWAEILKFCSNNPRTKYELISRLNLSWDTTEKAISFLLSAKLLEKIVFQKTKKAKYQTTAKGKEAVDAYQILITEYFA